VGEGGGRKVPVSSPSAAEKLASSGLATLKLG